MKWGIVIFLFLGIVAALCAAVLVGAVKLDAFGLGSNKGPRTVDVIVAAKDLPSSTIITPECIEKKTLPLSEVPLEKRAEKLAQEAASVDRVLRIGVVKGAILTESSFLPQGSAEELMAKIPPGMRAFTVNLREGVPDRSLLRPGSIVDIVAITKLDRNQGGQTIATPLLSAILVLAVQGESVISDPTPDKTATTSSLRSRGVDVTVQVDNQQAAALQLALSRGSIALILRNPRDKMTPSTDPIMLDEGGRYIPIRPEDLLPKQTNGAQNGGVSDPNRTPQGGAPVVPVSPSKDNRTSRNERRTVIIHRGTDTKEETLEEPKEGNADSKG